MTLKLYVHCKLNISTLIRVVSVLVTLAHFIHAYRLY
jgi:hypothetical protein